MDKITKDAMAEALTQQLANAFSGNAKQLSENDINQMFIKRMNDPSAQKVVMENDIELRKDSNDKKWKVVNNNTFLYAVTGNFGKSLNIASEAPGAAEDSNAPGGRSNPIKIGETGQINVSTYYNNKNINYQLGITVRSVIRGNEAWGLIQKENQFNSPPPEGKEYMLVKASVEIKNADSTEKSFTFSKYDFKFEILMLWSI